MSVHGEKCDRALRRLREALDPLLPLLQEAAHHQDRVAMVQAAPAVWSRLVAAIADAEPWPMELLGPVEVLAVDSHNVASRVPAWFTRGWHDLYRFALYARRQSRGVVGGALKLREMPIGLEIHHAWWAPPNETAGRALWEPVPPYHPDAVPVTVWCNPDRSAA